MEISTLNKALAMYYGNKAVAAIYIGSKLVWESQ